MTLYCDTHNWMCVQKMLNHGLDHGLFISLFKRILCHIHWILYLNFKTVLALPKTARSAQTHKIISFIWIVWSTLYVYLCLKSKSIENSNLLKSLTHMTLIIFWLELVRNKASSKVGYSSWHLSIHGRSQPRFYYVKFFFSVTKGRDYDFKLCNFTKESNYITSPLS